MSQFNLRDKVVILPHRNVFQSTPLVNRTGKIVAITNEDVCEVQLDLPISKEYLEAFNKAAVNSSHVNARLSLLADSKTVWIESKYLWRL